MARMAVGFVLLLLLPAFAQADINAPMSFRRIATGGNCAFCVYTLAEGIIERDTADKFEAYLTELNRAYPNWGKVHPGHIRFNSQGGSIDGSLELGNTIRELNLQTVIVRGDVCYSACAYAYLGGSERRIGRAFVIDGWTDPGLEREGLLREMDGCIGVHQFFSPELAREPDRPVYSPRNVSDAQRLVAKLTEYVRRMGVSPAFVETASRTSPFHGSLSRSAASSNRCALNPPNVFIIPSSLQQQWRVVTNFSEPGKWTLEPEGKGISARIVQDQRGHHIASIEVLKLLEIPGRVFLRYTLFSNTYKFWHPTLALDLVDILGRGELAELIVDSRSVGYCEFNQWQNKGDQVYGDCEISNSQVQALMDGDSFKLSLNVAHAYWELVNPSEFSLDGSRKTIERALKNPI